MRIPPISVIPAITLLLAVQFFNPFNTYAAGPAPVNLLSAGNFSILSKTAITNVPNSIITGNVGASPITGAAIGLTCTEVTGTIYSVDAAGPLPCRVIDAGLLTTAVSAMEAAFIDAAGRPTPTMTGLWAGSIGGLIITPGLYKWNSDVTILTDLTISGNVNDVWIFQISGNLTIASATKVLLAGGANAANIFWQVDGPVGATLGTTSTFNGNILSSKQIILQTGATLNGRALAQTQVVLDQARITLPALPTTGTLRVVKQVINSGTGVATVGLFNLHVTQTGADVLGSPATGTGGAGRPYTLLPGNYLVSEDPALLYTASFAGDCTSTGQISIAIGDNKTCTVTNTFSTPVVVNNGGGGSGGGGLVYIDNCPNGDTSPQYYDGLCAAATSTGTTTVTASGTVTSTGTTTPPVSKPTPTPTPSFGEGEVAPVVSGNAPVVTGTQAPTSVPRLPRTGATPTQSSTPIAVLIVIGLFSLIASVYGWKKLKN